MIWIIVVLGFILRTYRISDFLGFWFDQGRDGVIIWNLIHHREFFLIGPTTGIEGIFLGPFYYYLIAPFYALGNGNPVVPALFMGVLNTVTIYLLYVVGKRFVGRGAGLIAAALYAFSFQFISASRWLANPTPLPFFAILAIWSLLEIVHNNPKKRWWPLLGLTLGLSLQLEAASATFFLPVTLLVLVWCRKGLAFTWKKFFLLAVSFGVTLLPQLLFDFRNNHILFAGFYKFLVGEKSFQGTVTGFYSQRLAFYLEIFTNKFVIFRETAVPLALATLAIFIWSWRKMPRKFTGVLLTWWLLPVVALLFYHGNHGYVWDYYFTGVYPVLCLLLGSLYYVFMIHARSWLRWTPAILLVVIFKQNLVLATNYYFRSTAPPYINLTSEIAAVDWVYEDAGSMPFNTDVYVPPVIPHAYDYVFLWRGATKYRRQPNKELVKRLYTLREPDAGHQSLLDAWMARQAGIGSIEETRTFGPITGERRVRFDVNRK